MVNPAKVVRGLIQAEDDLGDFIKNGPADGLPGHVRDKFRHRCNEFANLPGWARALSGVAGGSIGRFCRPYWDDNGWDGPEKDTPFPGGQCAINYRPSGTYTRACGVGGQGNWTAEFAGPGPISGIGTIAGRPDIPAIVYTNGQRARLNVGSTPILLFGVSGVNCNVSNSERVATSGSVKITAVNPQGGAIDNCGDPPAPLIPGPNPPPNPGPLPGPEPTDNPDPENPIPFFPIPPFEDPVFGPQPITGPSDSPAPGPPPPAGDDGLPGDPDAIGGEAGEVMGGDPGEDIDFGVPPEGRTWVGCIVQATVDSRVGGIPGTGPISTVWPAVVGNCALKYSTYYSTSIPVRSKFTELFRRNNALIVTGCFLHALPGTSLKVFPVSAETCPENPCNEA